MDTKKCEALKDELESQDEPQAVSVAKFFDGNDDLGSIGCNLEDHPGIPAFKKTLEALERRPDVDGVWVLINELDPGEDSWPFAETVVVAGKISAKELRKAVQDLEPSDVADASEYQISPELEGHASPLQVVWWD